VRQQTTPPLREVLLPLIQRLMSSFPIEPVPENLPPDERAQWQRRQLTAQNTLEIQALSGTPPGPGTVEKFQCYVRGEITLAEAIAQVREQMAQEHAGFRQYLNRSQEL
jgi:hypothetical protein